MFSLKPLLALLPLLAACAAPPPPPSQRTELPLRVRWVRAERGAGRVRLVGRVEWARGLAVPLTVRVHAPRGGPRAQAVDLVRQTLPPSARAGAHEVAVTLEDAEGTVLVADVRGEGFGVHAEVAWSERPAPSVRPRPSGPALP